MTEGDPRHILPATAIRALGITGPDTEGAPCYGRTVAGTPCELAAGHYPATKHLVTMGGTSWLAFTDESMADFARIANEQANAHICDEEHHHAGH